MLSTGMQIRENVPLAPLTTLGVGGNARFFVSASTSQQVADAVAFSRAQELPLFVLGGGSNLVISDQGWNGMVLYVDDATTERREFEGKIHFDAGAGVSWDDLVRACIAENCAGVECLSGIPGSVGGTPVQNVGAYGQEVSETVVSVLAFDLCENRARELQAAECGFSYRTSIFNSTQRDRYIILRVSYALVPDGRPELRYADLQKYFAGGGAKPSLGEVRKAVMTIRAAKGMLISPGDPDSRSAGSFFKNPVLSSAEFAAIEKKAASRNLQIPSYPALAQRHKISAAWLVENSGFRKGFWKGNAGISSKHALAIVNHGNASADEIISLKNEIQDAVQQLWDIRLQPEPVLVGF